MPCSDKTLELFLTTVLSTGYASKPHYSLTIQIRSTAVAEPLHPYQDQDV